MKGWKTILANLLLGLLYLLAWQPLTAWVDPQYIVMATAGINLVLRFFTTTPVGKPE